MYVLAVIPLGIVILCLVLYLDKYGTNDKCWLTFNNYIILAMLGPILFLILVSDLL